MKPNYQRPEIEVCKISPDGVLSTSTTNPYLPVNVPDDYLNEDEY